MTTAAERYDNLFQAAQDFTQICELLHEIGLYRGAEFNAAATLMDSMAMGLKLLDPERFIAYCESRAEEKNAGVVMEVTRPTGQYL